MPSSITGCPFSNAGKRSTKTYAKDIPEAKERNRPCHTHPNTLAWLANKCTSTNTNNDISPGFIHTPYYCCRLVRNRYRLPCTFEHTPPLMSRLLGKVNKLLSPMISLKHMQMGMPLVEHKKILLADLLDHPRIAHHIPYLLGHPTCHQENDLNSLNNHGAAARPNTL